MWIRLWLNSYLKATAFIVKSMMLMIKNAGLVNEFNRFARFCVDSSNGSSGGLMDYVQEHGKVSKNGKILKGEDRYGWLNFIRGSKTSNRYQFLDVPLCPKHETKDDCCSCQTYMDLSRFTHNDILFGTYDENVACYDFLNARLPFVRYLYESFDVVFSPYSADYQKDIATLNVR